MDVIILAAGRNERLKGIVPLYHKPLLVVNGKPLIVRMLDIINGWTTGKIVIVVAPENAKTIVEMTRDCVNQPIDYIIQPYATGPGNAFIQAAEICKSKKIMILCGDNYFQEEDLRQMFSLASFDGERFIIGTRTIKTKEEAQRFTVITPKWGILEGLALQHNDDFWENIGGYRCWVGPLIVPHPMFRDILNEQSHHVSELKIGEHLDKIGLKPTLVDCDCLDIGVPEVVEDATAR